MQIPLLSGVYTDSVGNVRQSYPVNLVPVPKQSGVSAGYFRAADGIVAAFGASPVNRGNIAWNGKVYGVFDDLVRRIESDLTSTGIIPSIGNGTNQPVAMDYGFDRLAIVNDGQLWYLQDPPGGPTTLAQVTDPDLGYVSDVVHIDGYFLLTDGEFIIATDLNDPTSINPLKYGSAEIDPDPLVGLLRIRNELAAIGTNTIEFFDNVGGSGFPFQRIEGAQIMKGAVARDACCVFMDGIAFVGSGRNEAPSVYIGAGGTATRIATQEIDILLGTMTTSQLSAIYMEVVTEDGHNRLMIHLPDRCLVYDAGASQVLQQPVWYTLTSSASGFSQYRAKYHVRCYDKWIVGDPATTGSFGYGYLTDTVATHYGLPVRHELQTLMAYNESRGAIVHSLELVSTTYGAGTVNTSQSVDGINWSANVPSSTAKRIQWRRTGSIREWRIQRFQWDSSTRIVPMRLEAVIEPLAY